MIAEWFQAAEQGHTEILVDCLGRGADVNAQG